MKTIKATLCIQCTDVRTGVVGDFLTLNTCAPFSSITPVFGDLVEAYAWLKCEGWQHVSGSTYEIVLPSDCCEICENVYGENRKG